MLARRINAKGALKTIEPLYDYILIRARVSYTMIIGRSPYRVSHRHAKSDRQGKTSNGHCGPASTLGARANQPSGGMNGFSDACQATMIRG